MVRPRGGEVIEVRSSQTIESDALGDVQGLTEDR
jgi:hypothetical protein